MNAGSFLFGPVIGAALYAAFPLSVVLLSDVVGAILASIALGIVKIPELPERNAGKKDTMTEFRDGLRVFREDRALFSLVVAEALCMFFYAPLSSFYPLMTSDYFGLSAGYGSAVELAFAIGMITSSLLFSGVIKAKRKIRISFIGLMGMGFLSAACGMVPSAYAGWFVFAALYTGLGAFSNVHTIPLNAYIQETVDPAKMGRAFSVLTLISSVSMPAGLLVSSPVAEKVGVDAWFFLSGIAMLAITAAVLLKSRAGRKKDRR